MRGPPGSTVSLETGINGAFGQLDVYAAMILEVHDTIEGLDPDMGMCIAASDTGLLADSKTSLRRLLFFSLHARNSPYKTKVHCYNSLLAWPDSKPWNVYPSSNRRLP